VVERGIKDGDKESVIGGTVCILGAFFVPFALTRWA
jgi:hypothetical protein